MVQLSWAILVLSYLLRNVDASLLVAGHVKDLSVVSVFFDLECGCVVDPLVGSIVLGNRERSSVLVLSSPVESMS